MSGLGVLIVDDEPLARARLARQLLAIADSELLGEAGDVEAALEQIELLDPDLVLLDVEMPGRSGLELAQQLSALDNPPAVIFCTAHEQFALPAFATAAVGYLLKPVTGEQLSAAIGKARQLNKTQLQFGAANTPGNPQPGRSQLKATSRRGVQLLEVDRIRCFVADSKYVIAHHAEGETILDESLKELEQEFGGRFVRVHRNALVAMDYVSGLLRNSAGQYQLQLRGVDASPLVSRRMLARVKSLLA